MQPIHPVWRCHKSSIISAWDIMTFDRMTVRNCFWMVWQVVVTRIVRLPFRYWPARTGTTSCTTASRVMTSRVMTSCMTASRRTVVWRHSAPLSASTSSCFLSAETVSTKTIYSLTFLRPRYSVPEGWKIKKRTERVWNDHLFIYSFAYLLRHCAPHSAQWSHVRPCRNVSIINILKKIFFGMSNRK